MGRRLFKEWQVYEDLEPFPAEQADYNAAHIVQVTTRSGKPLMEYMLPFGDRPSYVREVQTSEWIESQIDIWCNSSNMIIAKSEGKEWRPI